MERLSVGDRFTVHMDDDESSSWTHGKVLCEMTRKNWIHDTVPTPGPDRVMTPFVFTSSRDIGCVLARAKVEVALLEKVLVYHDISTGTGDMETITCFCYTGPVNKMCVSCYISDTTMKRH